MERLVSLFAWMVSSLADLAGETSNYVTWGKVLLMFGAPTAILAIPVFLVGRRHGLKRAIAAALWPAAGVALIVVSVLMLAGSWDPASKFATGFLAILSIGAIALLWLPVSLAAAVLGARRRAATAGEVA